MFYVLPNHPSPLFLLFFLWNKCMINLQMLVEEIISKTIHLKQTFTADYHSFWELKLAQNDCHIKSRLFSLVVTIPLKRNRGMGGCPWLINEDKSKTDKKWSLEQLFLQFNIINYRLVNNSLWCDNRKTPLLTSLLAFTNRTLLPKTFMHFQMKTNDSSWTAQGWWHNLYQ